jgi:hypothetical protein
MKDIPDEVYRAALVAYQDGMFPALSERARASMLETAMGHPDRTDATLWKVVAATVDAWEAVAPPRGDGYDCSGACAHCCGQHPCDCYN